MEPLECMQRRHSVRQYTDQPIEPEKRAALDALVADCNTKYGLHLQIFYDEPKCFDSFMAHYGKFSGVRNYIALVGPKGADLDEKLGYAGEQLVLLAQSLGLNTCWVAMTHGKSSAQIQKGEKQVCLIPVGYGCTAGVPHKSKPLSAVIAGQTDRPAWFVYGVEAALLAPTAMNQQKFCFSLLPDGRVQATAGKGFYTKVDLGIVKYHFETVTGKACL